MVEKDRSLTGQVAEAGDVILGLASSGLQSSGYSLVRKVFFHDHDYQVTHHFDELGRSLGEELLEPTLIYVKPILSLLSKLNVVGIANISGGGLPENLPRSMPGHLDAVIKKGSWPIHPIFGILQRIGNVDEVEMYNTFNMGIGMATILGPNQVDGAIEELARHGSKLRHWRVDFRSRRSGFPVRRKIGMIGYTDFRPRFESSGLDRCH